MSDTVVAGRVLSRGSKKTQFSQVEKRAPLRQEPSSLVARDKLNHSPEAFMAVQAWRSYARFKHQGKSKIFGIPVGKGEAMLSEVSILDGITKFIDTRSFMFVLNTREPWPISWQV